MLSAEPVTALPRLQRLLCLVVLVIVVLATLCAWVAISNFSRIGV